MEPSVHESSQKGKDQRVTPADLAFFLEHLSVGLVYTFEGQLRRRGYDHW